MQDAIIRHVKGQKFDAPILRPTSAQPNHPSMSSDGDREPFEERLVEVALAGKVPKP